MIAGAFKTAATLAAALSLAVPALAANEVVITQAKALAGGVTPGDTAGYPVTVSQAGAYVLGSNLNVPSGQIGIVFTAGGVTLDLAGYTLTGGGVANFGIVGNADAGTVRNGTITRFKYDGIYTARDYWVVEDIRAILNGRTGIALTANLVNGKSQQVRRSNASDNGYDGIQCGYVCLVESNVVVGNDHNGINFNGTAIGNIVTGNTNYGLYSPATSSGYVNNVLIGNGTNVLGINAVHPNYCYPSAC
jgi:hypothetical protein